MERPPRACSSASGPPSTSSSSSQLASSSPAPIRPASSSASRRLPRAIALSHRHFPALRAARLVSSRATPSGAPSSGVAATAREVEVIDDAAAVATAATSLPPTTGTTPTEEAAPPPPPPPPRRRPPLPPAVAVALSRELPAAPDAAAAASALASAVEAAQREFSAFGSGLVRLEVPLPPRSSCSSGGGFPSSSSPPPPPSSALAWLAAQSDSEPALLPRVFFSPRRDPPGQGTSPGAAAAAAAGAGAGATAGAGGAWLWRAPASGGGGGNRGGNGSPTPASTALADALGDAGRFLSGAAASPRVRAFVAGRFDEGRGLGGDGATADPGWAPFGAFTVVIPRLEFVEGSTCDFLCCTLAWREKEEDEEEEGSDTGEMSVTPSLSLAEAAAAALASLAAMSPTSASQQPLPSPGRSRISSKSHFPDEKGWAEALEPVVSAIEREEGRGGGGGEKKGRSGDDESGGGAGGGVVANFDTRLARDEFRANGVAGLESLLASLEPVSGASSAVTGGGGEKNASPSPSSSLPPALSKVVLARRTDVEFDPSPSSSPSSSSGGGVDPTELVAALAAREPRAYQFLLDLGAPKGEKKAEGGDAAASADQSFLPAFVCSSPEQLFARTGCAVASEAVAGTRARGAPADAEADFWLSLDLLSSPKDHAEFVIVRDWVAGALERVCCSRGDGGEEEAEAESGRSPGGGGGDGDEQSPTSSSSSSSFSPSSSSVRIDRPKGILKQGGVQHLHARLSGTLRASATDADVLAALHPTPAVCGRPRALAKEVLRGAEGFDRGLYAGPVGWVSGSGAEFAVAIRSARLDRRGEDNRLPPPPPPPKQQQEQTQHRHHHRQHPASRLSAFAGVGVVRGSRPREEWAELELKVEQLLSPLRPPADPLSEPNPAAAAAALLVEELCRLGCPAFCVAPGARSSPLALAVARHPVASARLHRGLDERSLAFFALGVGRATGRAAAVVTTSGTAVANLLPAAVEAAMAGAPLLLLTADRPASLRGSGANQTIDQVGIFGTYARYFADVAPPCSEEEEMGASGGRAAAILSEVGRAYDAACRGIPSSSSSSSSSVPPSVLPGPAHLNLQFSEPLGRSQGRFPRGFWSGVEGWLRGKGRFVVHEEIEETVASLASSPSPPVIPAWLLELVASAERPLLVLGEARTAGDAAAAARIAAALNKGAGSGGGSCSQCQCLWPVAADALSGVRVGRRDGGSAPPPYLLSSPDAALASGREKQEGAWSALRPDLILQVGGRLTSKRLAAFLGWSVSSSSSADEEKGGQEGAGSSPTRTRWVLVDEAGDWFDPAGPGEKSPTARVSAPAAALAAALEEERRREGGEETKKLASPSSFRQREAFASLWLLVDAAAASAAAALLEADTAAAAAVAASGGGGGGGIRGISGGGGFGGTPTGLLSEPAAVALVTSKLPRGASLFVGNSMPIRDVEAYSSLPQQHLSSSLSSPPLPSLGDAPALAGAPSAPRVAASRGASGIDGVLSTAAGFCLGTGRPATLVVGDLSFLHDTNGLALLRDGEGSPPLTVVVLNNDGGGIFHLVQDIVAGNSSSNFSSSSFPTSSLGPGELDAVWATPQGADLGALCRAHGVPHQKVFSGSGAGGKGGSSSSSSSLLPASSSSNTNGPANNGAVAALSSALDAAAALGSSSVVEVVCPRRERNAELHRRLSEAAGRAGRAAARLWARAGGGGVSVVGASVRSLRIPLTRPLTTTTTTTASGSPSPSSSQQQQQQYRQCFLLRLDCETGDGRRVSGEGEISPLPGLSQESAAAAAAQAASLCSILNTSRTPLPLDAPALAGGMTRWLSAVAGGGAGRSFGGSDGSGKDKEQIAASVRFGVEAAVLGALAEAAGCDVPGLLAGFRGEGEEDFKPSSPVSVPVAGLISAGSPSEAAALAAALAAAGHRAVKVKVARRGSTPSRDAEIVRAVAAAVSADSEKEGRVSVRADANRGWTLEEASEFAVALFEGGGVPLDFLEEPLADPSLDLESFAAAFPALPLALDETVDEALSGSEGGSGSGSGVARGLSALLLLSSSFSSPAALVLKPSVLGGYDAVAAAARAASAAGGGGGIRCVVSSAFEGGAGLSAAAALAGAISSPPPRGGEFTEEVHGLGTASWFSPSSPSEEESGGGFVSAARAGKVAAGAPPPPPLRPRWQEERVAVPGAGVVFRTRTLSATAATAATTAAAGQEEQPLPPPLVVLLLHGFMGTAEDWEGVGEGLLFSAESSGEGGRRRGVVVVAADLPLHGQTTTVSPSDPSAAPWPAAVAAVRELCAALSERHAGGGPVSVVGYSLGARLAAAAEAADDASGFARAIGRLALVAGGTAASSSAASARAARAARDDELARALLRSSSAVAATAGAAEAFARSWYASSPLWAPLRASRRRVFSAAAADGSSSSSSSSLLDAVVASRAAAIEERGADLAAALSGFSPGRTSPESGALAPSTTPTLFVAGGEDSRCASEAAAAAAAAAGDGNTELVILEGVGHAVPSEAPVALAGVLADWLL